jgi:hypothetical protein
MKRWIASTPTFCLALIIANVTFSTGEAQDPSPASPSDRSTFQTAKRSTAPDDSWMRGLDSVTGTEDVIGSGSLPLPVRDRFRSEPIDELPFVHPPHCPCCVNEQPVSRFRDGFYQGSSLTGGYLSDGGNDKLAISHYEATVRFGIPIDGLDNVLIIAPSFRQEFIDSQAAVDIPDQLFVTGVNFTWLKKYSDRWRALAMVAPSIRSDFQSSDEAVRIFGLGMLTYSFIPQTLDGSLGVVYLDRDDIPVLPALGLKWTPKPWWQFDLNFPKPRIAYRTDKCGGTSEDWIYTGVALGGNTWAVERANGNHDVLTLRDYQWVFGWEHLRDRGRGLFVETGFVFGRSLEFERGGEQVDFDDALFLRMGLNF